MLRKIQHSVDRYSGQFYWLSALVTIFATALFWIGYDCQWGHLYAPYPYHRLQVEALLKGQLSLSFSIEQLDHGLAWHNGQVNQVWGLGVPLWMTPFELAYRLFGRRVFPDRIVLLTAVALVAWYSSRGGIAIASVLKQKVAGICFVCLVLFFPPLWNLIRGQNLIFEETILYACLVSIALLVAVMRFLLLRKREDFWIVCILGSLSGLVRVTHGIYGVMAGLICGVVMLRLAISVGASTKRNYNWRKIGELLLGWTLLLAGFSFLAYSNSHRFGSVAECGHRLTNHLADVIYLTRFGNPFEKASVVDALKEFFSWLFLSPFHHSPDFVPWQASTYRWRGVDQATFDPIYLLTLILGCLAAAALICRRGRRPSDGSLFLLEEPIVLAIGGLLVWVIGSAIALASFYLYAPILTTRYILDFTPAFLAPFIVVLLVSARRLPRLIPWLLLTWIISDSTMLWLGQGNLNNRTALSREELVVLPEPTGKKLASFSGRYSKENHPDQTHIKYNGLGWEKNGEASVIITLMVDCPEFLEISIGERKSDSVTSDIPRAKIGNLELPVESITPAYVGSNLVINARFRVPERIRREQENQIVYLCLATSWDQKDRLSLRQLYEVRWR